jgi:hypothetical protein
MTTSAGPCPAMLAQAISSAGGTGTTSAARGTPWRQRLSKPTLARCGWPYRPEQQTMVPMRSFTYIDVGPVRDIVGLAPLRNHADRVTPTESLRPSHSDRVTPTESLRPSHSDRVTPTESLHLVGDVTNWSSPCETLEGRADAFEGRTIPFPRQGGRRLGGCVRP